MPPRVPRPHPGLELARLLQNLLIAAAFITGLVIWDLTATLPLPLGVAGHEGSTILVGLNGLRLLTDNTWQRLHTH